MNNNETPWAFRYDIESSPVPADVWELDTCEGDADTYRPGNLSKILTACGVLITFALIGLALI